MKKIKKQFCRFKEAKPHLTTQTPRKNIFKSCEFTKGERQTHKIKVLKEKEKEMDYLTSNRKLKVIGRN